MRHLLISALLMAVAMTAAANTLAASAERTRSDRASATQTVRISDLQGIEVVKATSDHYSKGMAGLMAPLQEHRISTPYFDNLKINPVGRTKAVTAQRLRVEPLYRTN